MPYVPPHLRSRTDEKFAPKIATSLAEAQAMSDSVKNTTKKSILADMLAAPIPKKAIAAAKAAKPKNSLSSMLAKVKSEIKSEAPVEVTQSTGEKFDRELDAILRALFEAEMANVKRVGNAAPLNFERRSGGSYWNERLESRFQGFKLQKLEDIPEGAREEIEKIMRQRFELAMRGVTRAPNAGPLDFSRRVNGSYRNERLESRFQGYLMGVLKDFGKVVLNRMATNRVASNQEAQ